MFGLIVAFIAIIGLSAGGIAVVKEAPKAIPAISGAYEAVVNGTVPPALIVSAGNIFDAVEITGTHILKVCTPEARPAACDDTTLRKMAAAIKAGRPIRDGLEQFVADHPGKLGPKGAYDLLTQSISAIQQGIDAFNGAAS